ncbi:uncharacterized protein SCHCODRAFT_02279054 [Schizophyllum commune H4-8]|uniref:uncharacterized protein n=1 Tax=Schizophyllum commune (strain H4-8 / FGSC 9210) TaxID=578458 RepID=UPI00215F77A1|nr:uncharacterized protein SCHCODRAFT_02279054 [Schizophyllum commune H4-8]KAI5891971.1 hypothetical protein SCHCODRAFT_02279054 [Schizophyllum commune H4-8]
MAPLLPQDLLDLILDRLGAQMDYESLCRCALAHRSMRERSQQLLFAELRVTVPEFVPADQNRRARTLPERLLATLEKTPRLSQYIRILLVVSERPGWDGLPVLLHGLSQESALPRLLPGLPLLHTLKLVALSDDRAPELGDALVDALLRTSVVELGLHNVHAPDRLLRTLPPRLRQLTLDEVIWGNTGISEMPPDSCHDPLKLVLYGGEIPIEFTLIPFARTNTRCIVDLDLTYVEHLNAHAWRMLAIEPLWKLQCITFGCYPNLGMSSFRGKHLIPMPASCA